MMIGNSSKGNYQAKQEDNDGGMKIEKFSKAASTSSRQWTTMRNPRIVRVSRSLGGKDRHSKVCTIRGLRDRRIRLSVPTAIQLYDLQDRLGLSQPSKVVDWLLEATKSDIDKLPPLDFPQFFRQTLLPPHHHHEPAAGTSFSLGGFYDTNLIKDMDYSVARLKGKEAESVFSKWWMKTNEQDQNQSGGGASNSHKLFQIGTNNSSNANAMTYNSSSYYHMDVPSNLSLSQFGSHGNHLFPTSSGSAMQFSSSNLSVVPSCSQLLFCPSSATPTPPPSSLFTPHAPFMSNNSMESTDHIPRQSSHFQFLSSSSSQLNMPHVFNSPLGQRHSTITPFSSKLLDSDNHNNHSQPEDMDSARS